MTEKLAFPSINSSFLSMNQDGLEYGTVGIATKLVIVAHFPGHEEKKQDCPMVGPAGKNLYLLLASAAKKGLCAPQQLGTREMWRNSFGKEIVITNLYNQSKGKKRPRKRPTRDEVLEKYFESNKPILVVGDIATKRVRVFMRKWKTRVGEIVYSEHPDPRNSRNFWSSENVGKIRAFVEKCFRYSLVKKQ